MRARNLVLGAIVLVAAGIAGYGLLAPSDPERLATGEVPPAKAPDPNPAPAGDAERAAKPTPRPTAQTPATAPATTPAPTAVDDKATAQKPTPQPTPGPASDPASDPAVPAAAKPDRPDPTPSPGAAPAPDDTRTAATPDPAGPMSTAASRPAPSPTSTPVVVAKPDAAAPATPAIPAQPRSAARAPAPAASPAAPTPEPTKPEAAVDPPSYDIVRVDADGLAVLAGRAPARSRVTVLDGDVEIASAIADRRGEWAIVTEKPLAAGNRELGLTARLPNGVTVSSQAIVVVLVPERAAKPQQPPQPQPQPGTGQPPAQPEAMPQQQTQPQPQPSPPTVVRLPRQPGDASTVLQRPRRTGPPRLSLDIVDYDSVGNVILTGSARAGAVVRIYVDNTSIGVAKTGEGGNWRLTPEATVQPGNYRLRVDQINPNGRVTQRIEMPFTRADPARVLALMAEVRRARAEQAAAAAAASQTAPASGGQAAADTDTAATDSTDSGRQGAVAVASADAGAPGTLIGTLLEARPNWKVIVQPGNSLWRIARRVYGEGVKYSIIYQANDDQIRDPDLIYPGQIFDLPDQKTGG